MRILIVYNTALDGKTVSGVHRHFAGVVNEWIAAGHAVDFLAARAAWPVFRQLFPRSRLISSDNCFDAARYLARTWRYFFPYGWRLLTCHFTRFEVPYEVVLACGQAIFETYPAWRISRRLRAKFAVKIHHVLAAQAGRTGFFDRLFLLTERWSTRLLNRHADVIICGTELIARDFHALETRLGLPPHPTSQIGYGLDLDRIPFAPDTPRQFDAVLLGRVHEHKGVFDAPALWQAVCARRPGSKLLIIGEGSQREALQRAFETVGLGGVVTFTGGIPDAGKNALLAQTRVGLSLSREEGWGLSVTEFLAAGLPVVAMDLPVFHHVFPGQLDLVPMGDTTRCAERVLAWLADDAGRLAQARRGRDFVARYDHREVARAELAALQGSQSLPGGQARGAAQSKT